MSSVRSKTWHRVLAAFLSLMMVFSAIPFSTIANAATTGHPDAVTITVTDEKNQPVENASVEITVNSVSKGDGFISATKTTDKDGVVEVMTSAEFVSEDMTLSAVVTASGYRENNLAPMLIATDKENYTVKLVCKLITDVVIEGRMVPYNGQEQELVSVTAAKGDTVTYAVDGGEPTEKVPTGVDVCEHKITVTVSREGMDDLVKTVIGKIEPAEITDISIEGKTIEYNEQEQKIINLNGRFQTNDSVTWIVNEKEIASREIPTAEAVGAYMVSLKVSRGANYKELHLGPVRAEITAGTLVLKDLTVKGLESIYTVENGTPKAQPAVSVKNPNGYKLKYQLDDGDGEVSPTGWVDEIPMVTNAGSYIVWVKAVKNGYNDSDVEVTPAASAMTPYNVYIAKASQSFSFNNPAYANGERTTKEVNMIAPFELEYDFSATDKAALAKGTISYSVEFRDEDQGIATIDKDKGRLKVAYPGEITVVATLSGDANYDVCQIRHVLEISAVTTVPGAYVSFSQPSVEDYIIGQNDGVAAVNQAFKTVRRDRGQITYSVEKGDLYGLTVNESGEVRVADYGKLAAVIKQAGGTLPVTVRADKSVDKGFWGGVRYPADHVTYTFQIKFLPTPASAITLSEPDGSNGWYITPPLVTPVAEYSVAKMQLNAKGDNFKSTVSIDDQGSAERVVYLRDDKTGGITAPIAVNVSVDTQAPVDLKLSFSELTLIQKIGYELGIYNPYVIITFKAKDTISGVDHFNFSYTKEAGASDINADSIVDEYIGVDKVEDGFAIGEKKLSYDDSNQYRGKISFTATDKAGKVSNPATEDQVIVVDDVAPTFAVKYAGADPYVGAIHSDGKSHYFNGPVQVELIITEANFYAEDVKVTVSKDGQLAQEVLPKWEDKDVDTHSGTFPLPDDGEYVISVSYTDKANNPMQDYTSEIIVVDQIKPEVDIDYIHDDNIQKTIFTIREHNFSAENVTITGTMKDIGGKDIAFTPEQLTQLLRGASWEQEGDTYKYEYDGYIDGIYDLQLNYVDFSGWNADPAEEKFVIDHSAPEGVKIEYAKSPADKFLETITLGFYNPSVIVRFTAYDTSAGVKSFTWGYTKEAGASVINHPDALEDEVLIALQDEQDPSKFTAQKTIEANKLEQYRGYVSVSATDNFDNTSEKKDDRGNIIVVDTFEPTRSVEYSAADRVLQNAGKPHYYHNKDVQVTIKITEANFYPEDVKISVTKDGTSYDYGKVSWGSRNKDDETVGTFTLKAPKDHSGDGDFVIRIAYTDRSSNSMEEYVSDVHTIDTRKPEIRVDYQNQKAVNTLRDRDGFDRKYFKNVQTAVVTIDERNFNPEEVKFSITAKDVAGNALDVNALCRKSEWTTGASGSQHRLTLTYPGDANYTFDIAYTDLATNPAKDYTPDHFTVDKTAPENLTVNYSTSVLDTVIESVSFGFYNARMTVTLSAEDPISGVHSFLYSYENAPGVSSVNAELLNQAIAAADITYSSNGKKATATFEIPKSALGSDNQFNGTVTFSASDRSENKSSPHKETKRIVVDSIAPTAQVSYNGAANEIGDVSYYDGPIHASVTINEANFYAGDVQVMVSKDGGTPEAVTPSWSGSVDVHVGTFTLSEDGDYLVTIRYKDKSNNAMTTYTSRRMIVDTKINKPVCSINGVAKTEIGGAYKKNVEVSFRYEDQNFADKTISLTRTRFDSVEDVTSKFIKTTDSGKGGSGSFEIPSDVENDGIYVLTITMTDKAKHTAQTQVKFTVNRYGSVYEYNDVLTSLIKDGGQYVASVENDLVITEYNADRIQDDSLRILITRDGKPIDVEFTSNPEKINGKVAIGKSGWYQYMYTIKASNFAEDGVYKISLTSRYSADDSADNESASMPDNSIDGNGNKILNLMSFTVDSSAPEIRNIVNLEKNIVNAQTLQVKYTIVDVGGLKSIEVIVNGKTIDTITEFGDNVFNYLGQFALGEMADVQTVQLRVTDLAGNVTDTAAENFSTGDLYVFNDKVTVSTNFFVRWYANKPLFWGSICVFVMLAGASWFLIAAKRKKKEENE